MPVKLRDSKLYADARETPILGKLLSDSIPYDLEQEIEQRVPRDTTMGEATRVVFATPLAGGYHIDVSWWAARLDSTIDIDEVLAAGYKALAATDDHDVDEVASMCVHIASIELGSADFRSLDEDWKNMAFSTISGFCMIAFDDPLDVVVFLKPHDDAETTSPTIDWIWYKSRQETK